MPGILRVLLILTLLVSEILEAHAQTNRAQADNLSITLAAPSGPLSQRPHAVTIIFSRPMHSIPGTLAASAPVATVRKRHDNAEAAGHWVWYGTRTAVFYWETKPDNATDYEVIVPANTRAFDGARLDSPWAFSFSTPTVSVQDVSLAETEPSEGYSVNCSFNQPVLAAEVRRSIRIMATRNHQAQWMPFTVADDDGSSRTDYELRLDRTANSVDKARLIVSGDFHGAEGPLTSGKSAEFPIPGLESLKGHIECERNPRQQCTRDQGITLVFSKPVNNLELFRKARFSPHVDRKHYDYQGDTTFLDFTWLYDYELVPGKRYQVWFDQGLVAVDGEHSPPMHFEFQFESPVPRLEFGGSDGGIAWEDKGLVLWSQGVTRAEVFGAALERGEYFDWLDRKDRHFIDVQSIKGASRGFATLSKKAPSEFLDLPQGLWERRPGGAWLFAARGEKTPVESTRVITTSNLGMTTQISSFGGRVWVTRLSDATVVPNARVQIVRLKSKQVVFTSTTDTDGLVNLPAATLNHLAPADERFIVVAQSDNDWTYEDLSPPRKTHAPVFVDLFTERSLYQPGETVHVKAYYRRASRAGFDIPKGEGVDVKLYTPGNNILTQSSALLDDYGAFHAELQLPPNMPLGMAYVSACLRAPSLSGECERQYFHVARYRVLDIEAHGALDKKTFTRGDFGEFSLEANTLHGTPLSNARVRFLATLSPSRFHPEAYPEYSFSDIFDDPPKTLLSSELTLDASGHGKQRFHTENVEQLGLMDLSVEVRVAELAGQFGVSAEDSAQVHPGSFYAGIALDHGDHKYFVGQDVNVKLVAVEPTGNAVRAPLSLVVQRIGNDPDASGPIARESVAKGALVGQCAVTSEDSCRVRMSYPGRYLARVTGVDALSRKVAASVEFVVWPKQVQHWGRQTPQAQPELHEEQPRPPRSLAEFKEWCRQRDASSFNVFDAEGPDGRSQDKVPVDSVVSFCVQTPFAGKLAVSLERTGVLEQRIISTRAGGNYLEQRLPRTAYPRASVHFHWVGPVSHGDRGYREEWRGYELSDPSRTLDISIRTHGPYRPHSKANLELLVTRQGRPAAAQVTLWAVDEGVVSQSYYRHPEPAEQLSHFNPHDVNCSDSRSRLFFANANSYRTRAPQVRAGATSVSPHEPVMREDFPPVAWYLPNLMLDRTGRAKLSIPLPDNTTTWHIYAVAADASDGFGSTERKIVTSQPIVIRAHVPQFARLGDRYEASFTVDTTLDKPTDVDVELSAHGAVKGRFDGDRTLPAKGQTTLKFPVVTTALGRARLSAKITSGQGGDALTVTHDVKATLTEQSAAFSGVTRAIAKEPLRLPPNIDPTRGGLELHLSNSSASNVDVLQKWFEDYPYSCTEQLAARLVASLFAGQGKALSRAERGRLDALIIELLVRQREDGGFGVWPDSNDSLAEYSEIALLALLKAQRAHLQVPKTAVQHAVKYLEKRAPNSPTDAAFLEDLFAEAGHPRRANIERLLRQPEPLNEFARGLLVHAAALTDATLAHSQVNSLLADVVVSGAQAVVANGALDATLFASPTRTTASALRALAIVEPYHPLLQKLAAGLLSLRRGPTWSTTEENLWALIALTELRTVQNAEPIVGQVQLGSESLWKSSGPASQLRLFVPMQELLSAHGDGLRFEATSGTLYYEGVFRFVTRGVVEKPQHNGLLVERFFLPADASGPNDSHFEFGSYAMLDVLVDSPVSRDQVVIDVPLPAGFDAVDESLAATPLINFRHLVTRGPVSHLEHHPDRIVFYVDTLPAGPLAFTQLLRATTRGTFSAPGAYVAQMYAPDVFGRSSPTNVEVR